jgi:DNA-damage-inducible protein D
MDRVRISKLKSVFDETVHQINSDDNTEHLEIWFARELMVLLGYARWENFQIAIGRAVDSCKAQAINVYDHFREVTKMVGSGSILRREMADYYSLIPLTPKNEM